MEASSLHVLGSFVSLLLARHEGVQGLSQTDQALVYADALLNNLRQRRDAPDLPRQVVVIGPTQAGKSTVVNLLLGTEAAVANTLAGFTRHGQGFCTVEPDEDLHALIARLLPGLTRRALEGLTESELNAYALQALRGGDPFTGAEPAIIWDTPDFDSVSSRGYRAMVPKLCAMADLIVLVVSREKYADQSVWETLRLLGQIDRPLLVCLNKATANTESALIDAVRRKFEQERIGQQGVVALPYQENASLAAMAGCAAAQALRLGAGEALRGPRDISVDEARLTQFLRANWSQWTAGLREEHAAHRSWEGLIEEVGGEMLERYQRDYLRSPDYGDTLQRAIVRLLELLEVPGAGATLAKARTLLTWPGRKLMGLLKARSGEQGTPVGHETEALQQGVSHLLLRLERIAGEHAAGDGDMRLWWRLLWQEIIRRREALTVEGGRLIEAHQQAFEPYIEEAAQSLHRYLQDHPVTLNSLRTARVGADAAAVLLAIKTGGLSPSDLVLAPALLSVTSMLAEGAVGRYMRSVEQDLKRHQIESVQTHVLARMQAVLISVPDGLKHSSLRNIAPATLAEADTVLNLKTAVDRYETS